MVQKTDCLMLRIGQQGAFGSWYGYSVSSAGDVNGDGYSDVVVGAPNLNSYGGAYVYHAVLQQGLSGESRLVSSDTIQTANGISVACAGDVNGDGYSDVLIGLYKYTIGIVQGGSSCFVVWIIYRIKYTLSGMV